MTQSSPRQPAYDAVYAVIRQYQVAGLAGAVENARVWRAVEAALDAMHVPNGQSESRWLMRATFPNGEARLYDCLGLLTEEQARSSAEQHAALGLRCEVIRRRSTDEVIATYPSQESK